MNRLDSASMGDPQRFVSWEALELGLAQIPARPLTHGTLTRIAMRGERGVRGLSDSGRLTCEGGLVGDQWGRDTQRDPNAQLAVMEDGVAQLICNGQPLELAGDNLWLDLDLSHQNLPAGSRLSVGPAVLEVTALPHNGCRKFRGRFGEDALRFVSDPQTRSRNLRGIYLRVIEPGTVSVGDPVIVISRAP